jgi:O-6-methylguanine DNA methyltransferase
MRTSLVEMPIATPDGEFLARYSEKGLAELNFPKASHRRRRGDESQNSLVRDSSRRRLQIKIRAWHRLTEAALKKVLTGGKPGKFPPLDMAGTAFQQSVWNALRKIAAGKTKSYGEIAQAIGKPKAVRAVGGACGANPIPVLVPCHRVLAANKKLGGFSGGLDWKRSLLAREGILMRIEIEDTFVKAWRKAAIDLGFKFDAPYFRLKNGKRVEHLGLVHNYGGPIGTLISIASGPSGETLYPSCGDGYSQSCFGGGMRYNRKKWIKILCDWGFWGSTSEWPNWFSPGPVCHLQYVNGVVSPPAG